MTNIATIIKWLVIGGIALLIFLFYKSCRKDNLPVKEFVHDTTYVNSFDTLVIEKPVPVKVEYVREVMKYDTLTNIEIFQNAADTAAILERYFATRYYDTTIAVPYGKIRFADTVTQNRIIGKGIITNLSIPVEKQTVTVQEKKRIIAYFGIEAIGNQNNIPYASGITFGIKLRNDQFFEIKGLVTNDKPMYGFGLKFPIRLKK